MRIVSRIIMICLLGILNYSKSQQNCQQIIFSYDITGNRIQRVLNVYPCNSTQSAKIFQNIDSESSNTNDYPLFANAYPNPVQYKVNVSIVDTSVAGIEKQIILTDVSGKILYKNKTLDMNFQVDMNEYHSGHYFLIIVVENKKKKAFQLIKE